MQVRCINNKISGGSTTVPKLEIGKIYNTRGDVSKVKMDDMIRIKEIAGGYWRWRFEIVNS